MLAKPTAHAPTTTTTNTHHQQPSLRAQAWLKAPLVDPAAIRQRLDIVDALVTDQALREGVRDALRGELTFVACFNCLPLLWWWCLRGLWLRWLPAAHVGQVLTLHTHSRHAAPRLSLFACPLPPCCGVLSARKP